MDREQLIKAYLPVVHVITMSMLRRLPSWTCYDDIYDSGVTGLLSACNSWTEERDSTFRAYVYCKIRGAIVDDLRRIDPVPRRLRAIQKRVAKVSEELFAQLGREPTADEIKQAANINSETYKKVEDIPLSTTLSFDHPDFKVKVLAEESTLCELDRTFCSEEIQRVMREKLNQDEQRVIKYCFFDSYILDDIAEKLSITASRVCQIKFRAIEKLKRYLEFSEVKLLVKN